MNEDNKIQQLNEVMIGLIRVLKERYDERRARIRVAVLTFGDNVIWSPPMPVELSVYNYVPLAADGCTVFDGACAELSSKLLDWIRDDNGFYNPVIIAISDGCPTDSENNGFGQGLKTLKNNRFYHYARRFAIAIGSKKGDFAFANLADFTGTEEAVIPVDNIDRFLNKLFRFHPTSHCYYGVQENKPESACLCNKIFQEFLDDDDDFDFDDE